MLSVKIKLQYYSNPILSSVLRRFSLRNIEKYADKLKKNAFEENKEIFKKYGYGYGNKMLYNSKIEEIKNRLGYSYDYVHQRKKKFYKKKLEHILETTQPLPVSLKYFSGDDVTFEHEINPPLEESIAAALEKKNVGEKNYTHFPLGITHQYEQEPDVKNDSQNEVSLEPSNVDRDIVLKYEQLKKSKNWMTSYDNYEDDLEEIEEHEIVDWTVNYGTSDPNVQISSIPCGGCGALLHCKVRYIFV